MHTFEGPPLAGAEGIGALTLGGFLDEVADRFGPRQAVVGDGERRTWLTGEVVGTRSERRRHLVAVRVELHNQDGAVMAKATADVELPKE